MKIISHKATEIKINLCLAPTTSTTKEFQIHLPHCNNSEDEFFLTPTHTINVSYRPTIAIWKYHFVVGMCRLPSQQILTSTLYTYSKSISFFRQLPGRLQRKANIDVRLRQWYRTGGRMGEHSLELADFVHFPDVWPLLISSQQWPNSRLNVDTMTVVAAQPFCVLILSVPCGHSVSIFCGVSRITLSKIKKNRF